MERWDDSFMDWTQRWEKGKSRVSSKFLAKTTRGQSYHLPSGKRLEEHVWGGEIQSSVLDLLSLRCLFSSIIHHMEMWSRFWNSGEGLGLIWKTHYPPLLDENIVCIAQNHWNNMDFNFDQEQKVLHQFVINTIKCPEVPRRQGPRGKASSMHCPEWGYAVRALKGQ